MKCLDAARFTGTIYTFKIIVFVTIPIDSWFSLARGHRMECVFEILLRASIDFPPAIPRAKVNRYLRAYASWHGINSNDNSRDISYNTRVELVEKRLDSEGKQIGWTLTSKYLEELDSGLNRAIWNKEVSAIYV